MAKYNGSDPYFQIPRSNFNDIDKTAEINNLSLPAFKLYIWLKELEHRYTNSRQGSVGNRDFFFHSDKNLAEKTCMSISSIKRAKSELASLQYIKVTQSHFIRGDKLSWEHISVYQILK